jgi:MSHA biogenesis protein MshQ
VFADLPRLTITGKNRSGVTTANYDRGAFWKFLNTWSPAFFSSVGRASLDRRIPGDDSLADLDCSLESNRVACVAARLYVEGAESPSETDTTAGDGARTLVMPASLLLRYRQGVPNEDDRPFDAKIEVFTDKTQLEDDDGVHFAVSLASLGEPADHAFEVSGSEVWLGRYRQAGASGSELAGLNLPLYLETWNGAAFEVQVAAVAEDCTSVSGVSLDDATGNLAETETRATRGEPSAGVTMIGLSAPGAGNTGSIRVTPDVPAWLQFDWLGNGPVNPSGIAVFGGYGGQKPLIFRREVYR